MIHELEADSIIVQFGHTQLLTDVYLKCKTGEVIGVLGRNGSGKSSLLKVLFGTLHTDNKHICVDKKVFLKPYREKGLIAYLPQHSFLPDNLTVEKVVNLYFTRAEEKRILLQEARMKDLSQKKVSYLSGGELRYFELLLLVHLPVKFILLDEPFSGIEPLYRERITELIFQHRKTKGFIITDHDYRNIIEASDRIVLLVNGVAKNITDLYELESWGYVPGGTFSLTS